MYFISLIRPVCLTKAHSHHSIDYVEYNTAAERVVGLNSSPAEFHYKKCLSFKPISIPEDVSNVYDKLKNVAKRITLII